MANRQANHFAKDRIASTPGKESNRMTWTGRGKSPCVAELLESRHMLSLTAPVSYTIGTTNDGFVPNAAPQSVVTADFNGDGKLDLAIAHSSDSCVYLMLGNGNGSFQSPLKTVVGESIQGNLRAGDFN